MRMIYTLHPGLQFHTLPPFMTTTLWHCLDCCLLTSSLFTVSRPSLHSLPTAFDFHTYALFRKPLPPFVSDLFREPMHSLSRFYEYKPYCHPLLGLCVLFRGPVSTLFSPRFRGVCINIISPSSGAFTYISALLWDIFLPSSGGFQWSYFRSLSGACTKVISSHFRSSY